MNQEKRDKKGLGEYNSSINSEYSVKAISPGFGNIQPLGLGGLWNVWHNFGLVG